MISLGGILEKIAIIHDFTRGNSREDSGFRIPTPKITEYVAEIPAHQCFK